MVTNKQHPKRFIQGQGVIFQALPFLRDKGSVVVSGKRAWDGLCGKLSKVGKYQSLPEPFFVTEGNTLELKRLAEFVRERECSRVIGVGGGRAIDLGKVFATRQRMDFISIPTMLGSDAACSSVAVLYDENNDFLEYVDEQQSPEAVFVDLDIIRTTPPRYAAAGLAGGLSVFYEVEEVMAAKQFRATPTMQSYYKSVAEWGKGRLLAVSERAIEGFIHLSLNELEEICFCCLWVAADLFEHVGLSLGHGVYRALRGLGLSKTGGYLHGELVGLGLLCQLDLCSTHQAEREQVKRLVRKLLSHADWREAEETVSSRRDEYLKHLSLFEICQKTTAQVRENDVVTTTLENLINQRP